MAVWNGTVTTQLGLNLITKVMAGKTSLSFTGFKTSDGAFSNVELKSMASLPNVKQEFNVSNINIQNSTTVLVKGVVTNTGLSNQYLLNAVGLYATDPDLGEILFSVTTADIADVIPAKTNTNTTSLILNVLTSVTDANRVTLSLSQPAIVTTDMLEVHIKNTDLATDTIAGIAKIATQTEVDAGVEDTKIVTSKKLKARLDTLLTSIGTNFVKLTQLATETKAGIITEARIKEIAPQPDLTPYVPFSKGFRNQNSTNWFVGTNGSITWASNILEMWNGDNNQFMGTFHTDSYNSFYKVPNKNGGNWNRIIDEHELLDVTIRNKWKVIFDGGFGVQGGVVASLPNDWSDCLVYYRVYSAAGDIMNNSSMLITSSEKGGRYMVHYSTGGNHEIKINVNDINQVVLADRYGDAVINKVLYKNNR